MENEKESLIQKGIEETKQKFEIRKDLVGAGFTTSDFEELYATMLTRLGAKEPVPPKVIVGTKTYIPPEFGGTTIKLPHVQQGANYVKGAVLFLMTILLLATVLFFGSQLLNPTPSVSDEPLKWGKENVKEQVADAELSLGDEVLQTKVKATVVSAMIQGGRMGSYDGVCTDITVVAPVVCKQTDASFVIYAPMSNGTFFCEDKMQKGSIVPESPAQKMSCR